jgi:hypothetical protein
MKFRVTIEGKLSATDGETGDDLHRALAAAMGSLNGYKLGNPAIGLNAETGEIVISCAVEAEDSTLAVLPASDRIVLALHTAAIGTRDWPDETSPAWSVEFVNTRSEALAGV